MAHSVEYNTAITIINSSSYILNTREGISLCNSRSAKKNAECSRRLSDSFNYIYWIRENSPLFNVSASIFRSRRLKMYIISISWLIKATKKFTFFSFSSVFLWFPSHFLWICSQASLNLFSVLLQFFFRFLILSHKFVSFFRFCCFLLFFSFFDFSVFLSLFIPHSFVLFECFLIFATISWLFIPFFFYFLVSSQCPYICSELFAYNTNYMEPFS